MKQLRDFFESFLLITTEELPKVSMLTAKDGSWFPVGLALGEKPG